MRELKNRTGVAQVRAIAKKAAEMEKRGFGGKGMRKVWGNEVTQNIAVKSLNRWTMDVQSGELSELAKRLLSVDIDSCEGQEASLEANPDFTGHHFRTVRRPAYKMLIAGFSNRGDTVRRARAVELMRGEEKRVREMELSKADRLLLLV